MMRLGITGANGFIGSALRAWTGDAGLETVSVVRDESSIRPKGDDIRVVDDPWSSGAWADALGDVDCVVHLVSRAHHVGEGPEAYDEYYRDNVLVSESLMDGLARTPVGKVTYLSSIKAVGERTDGIPIDGNTEPAPTTAYGRTKLEAETRFIRWATDTSKNLVVLRPPLVYGPRVKGNFRSLLRIADSRFPLPIASIENRRSMIYIDNLCDAILASASDDVVGIRRVPVADTDALSTPDVVTVLRVAMGREPGMLRFPGQVLAAVSRAVGAEERFRRISQDLVIDSWAAAVELGWTPPRTAIEGLVETARWYTTLVE